MKDFYYGRLEQATLKLELARIGYDRKMKILATKLMNEDASLHVPIIDAICEMRDALDNMIGEAKYYKAKYQEECDKEGAENAKDSK